MTQPRWTAAIIALDEQRRLPGLLSRLGDADEIVVVDGGSRDATVQIAREFGARVLVRPFDTFSAQRNAAIHMALGEWVLFVDADERPSPALCSELARLLASRRYDAFRVPIRSSIFGRRFRYSGTQDDRPIRLVRREKATWIGDVHEVARISGRVGTCWGWLEHEAMPDLSSFLAKMHRYTGLAARGRVRLGVRPRRLHRWWQPAREIARRLIWKRGFLDSPQGWAFCLLSGLSEWVLAREHRRLWSLRHERAARDRASTEQPGTWHATRIAGTALSAESPTWGGDAHGAGHLLELREALR